MLFRTEIDIKKASFEIRPADRLLFVGSCFADNLGRRFVENRFHATVNPYGVMYNPASILHTLTKLLSPSFSDAHSSLPSSPPHVAVFTLGTNHVYLLKETGEIVDNCQKRPQRLFEEKELSVAECVDFLSQAVKAIQKAWQASGEEKGNAHFHVIVTVSPIRYAKYGFHGSQLSKATLLLAADELVKRFPNTVTYFPAYEIINDELRDYRFYKEDMLHPSDQAVEYIWQQFQHAYFGAESNSFLKEWQPIKEALAHKPFHPESEAYQRFLAKTKEEERAFNKKWFEQS